MTRPSHQIIVIHADESCLGNGSEGHNPGGAGALIEVAQNDSVIRRDLFISSPDTTNNRMALCGAIAVLAILSQKGKRCRIRYVSDSQYLVKGMNDWVPSWKARGWRRKGGKVENVELWQTLDKTASAHDVQWEWVRGHADHPKNEYADHLAVRAATHQLHSEKAVPSEFDAWLTSHKKFSDYDADIAFAETVAQIEGAR
jgi:ribonuclease HI